MDELNHLEENAKAVQEEFQQSCENRKEKGEISLSGDWMCTWEELCHKINDRNCVAMSLLDPKKSNWKISGQFNITVKSMSSYQSSFELLVKDLKQYKKEGYQIVLLSGSRTRAERLAKDLQEEGLNAFYGQDSDRILQPGEIMVAYGHARRGFEYPLVKFAVITETDIFGKEQKKRKKKKEYNGKRIQDFSELSIGDYVVHEKHGLGIYKGIEKVAVDKVAKDYIKIEYRNGSNLYILATQLDALQKYSGAETAKPPKLNRLGGQEWKKTKSRVRGAVQNIARELVELYAVRQEKKVMSVDQIPSGSESLKRCFRMRKQKISWLRSKILRKIWRAPRLWTVLCVGMSDMARQRLRCGLHLKQFRKAARLFILYRPRFLHSRFITPLFSE